MLARISFGNKFYVEAVNQDESLTREQLCDLTARAITDFVIQYTDELTQLKLKHMGEIDHKRRLAELAFEKSEACKKMAESLCDSQDELEKKIQTCADEVLDIFKRHAFVEGVISDISSQMLNVAQSLNEFRELSERAIAVIQDQNENLVLTFAPGTYQFGASEKMITLQLMPRGSN